MFILSEVILFYNTYYLYSYWYSSNEIYLITTWFISIRQFSKLLILLLSYLKKNDQYQTLIIILRCNNNSILVTWKHKKP